MIPSRSKMINSPAYRAFKKDIWSQVYKNYPQLEHQLKHASKPLKIGLHIIRYRDDNPDWDNRITTLQDTFFGYNYKKKKFIGIFEIDDGWKDIEFHPASWTVDKVNLNSSDDDYFILEFLDDVILVPKDSW